MVLGGAAGLAIGYLLVFWIQHRNGQPDKRAEPRHTEVAKNVKVEFPKFEPRASTVPTPTAPQAPAFVPPNLGGFGPSETGAQAPSPATASQPNAPPASKPASSTPRPSAPMTNPLDGLGGVFKLPPLVDSAPVVLSSVFVPEGKPLDITFNSVAASIAPEAGFFTERKDQSNNQWLVCYTPNLSGSTAEKTVIAEMAMENGQLGFTWRLPVELPEIRRELANCLIRLTCENVSKAVPLREAANVSRVAIDLRKDVCTAVLPIADAPREEQLRLEIIDLAGFTHAATLKEDKRVLQLKERTAIQFGAMKGAEIQLEFRRGPSGEFQVVLRPEFRENNVEKFVMTLTRLANMKAALERSIPEAEARIAGLEKDIRALDRELRGVGPRPGGAAFVAWQSKVNRLQSALSSANSKLSTQRRRLPEMKARLAAVPQVQSFLEGLHNKASLALVIYAECGDAKLSLVDARLDPVFADAKQAAE